MPSVINDTNTPQFTPYSGISNISNINNDKIELTKIYLKIYIRLFLYIQFKLNKKFNKSINSYNSKYQIDESTLINSIKYYKQEQELDRYLQSNDIFFIQPLFKTMCKDNYNDICIKYFNSFVKPNIHNNPHKTKEFLDQIFHKYKEIIKDYTILEDDDNFREIVKKIKEFQQNERQIKEGEFTNLMKEIKEHVNTHKSETPPETSREQQLPKTEPKPEPKPEPEPKVDNKIY